MHMKKIDINKWERKVPFDNFIKYTNPIFSLSVRLDVTALCERCLEKGSSFFADMLYIVSHTMNSIEEFRLRLFGGNVVLLDSVNPSYIVMSNAGVIATCRTIYGNGVYETFYDRVREDIERTKRCKTYDKSFNSNSDVDCFYVSCLPWADIISVLNPYDFSNLDNSSIPRVTWGRFVEERGKKMMTIDISAHHALIDGEPVCRAFNEIQKKINDEAFFAHGGTR